MNINIKLENNLIVVACIGLLEFILNIQHKLGISNISSIFFR